MLTAVDANKVVNNMMSVQNGGCGYCCQDV